MPYTLPIEIYKLLEEDLPKEKAFQVAKAIETSVQTVEQRAEAIAREKKLEVRDELSKELASKADISHVRIEIAAVQAEMDGLRKEIKAEFAAVRAEMAALESRIETRFTQLDRKFTIYFVVLAALIVLLNRDALELIFRVVGLAK
jgi:predicted  nucleic acid-binding Zn-ribbon protein